MIRNESLGGVRLQMNAASALRVLKERPIKSPERMCQATGAMTQTFKFPKTKFEVNMARDDRGVQRVESMRTTSMACALKTARGARAGYTERYTRQLYPDAHRTPFGLQLGTDYFGLNFSVQNGKVTQVHLGAGAE